MKIMEINPTITKLVDATGGYCPSAAKQIPHTKCICDNFRNQLIVGPCNCGRYEKVLEQSDIECLITTIESKLEDEPERGRLSMPRPLIVNAAAALRMAVKLMKENAALQDGYDAMARDLEARTRQVRELQEELDGPRTESD